MSRTSCRAMNKRGEPCRAAAGAGGLCHLHANPDFARKLGQQGGRKNRHFTGVDVDVPPNMTAGDLNVVGSRAISLVLSGQLQAREALAIAQLINSQARVIPLLSFENRFADLQHEMARILERLAEPQQGREVPIQPLGENESGREIATEPMAQAELEANRGYSNEAEPAAATESEHELGPDTDHSTK